MKEKLIILIVSALVIAVLVAGVLIFNNIKTNNSDNINQSNTNTEIEIIESESGNMRYKINLEINGRKLTATLEENKSSKEFAEKLKEGSITIDMHDYGNFEKVGDLGFSIARSDKQISVGSGDIVLYQGDKVTIYYNDNSWNFTKLGHIDNISDCELENLLGSGNVSVTFSL